MPTSLQVAKISIEAARAFTSLESLLELLAERIAEALPGDLAPALEEPSLSGFERFLGRLDERLDREGLRLLIALDEYEYLDEKIGQAGHTSSS